MVLRRDPGRDEDAAPHDDPDAAATTNLTELSVWGGEGVGGVSQHHEVGQAQHPPQLQPALARRGGRVLPVFCGWWNCEYDISLT